MKPVSLLPSTPELDDLLRAELAGLVEWTAAAPVAISAAPAAVDPSHDLYVRVVQGYPLEGDFLDSAVIHPVGAGGDRRVAEFAFAFMARTGKRSIAVDDSMRPTAAEVALDYAQILVDGFAPGEYESLLDADPERVEVVLTRNALLAEVVTRRMRGHAAASRRGPRFSLFEGAGTPVSARFAAAQLLELLGEGLAADRILRRLRGS